MLPAVFYWKPHSQHDPCLFDLLGTLQKYFYFRIFPQSISHRIIFVSLERFSVCNGSLPLWEVFRSTPTSEYFIRRHNPALHWSPRTTSLFLWRSITIGLVVTSSEVILLPNISSRDQSLRPRNTPNHGPTSYPNNRKATEISLPKTNPFYSTIWRSLSTWSNPIDGFSHSV